MREVFSGQDGILEESTRTCVRGKLSAIAIGVLLNRGGWQPINYFCVFLIPQEQVVCVPLKNKPEKSSSLVSVQPGSLPKPKLCVAEPPGPAHLCSLYSPNCPQEPSCQREGFVGKWVLQDGVGKRHSAGIVLCFVFSMFSAWSLFPPIVSAAQKPFNGSSRCHGTGWQHCGMAKAFG